MTIRLRAAEEKDWPAILEQADAALPWDASGNREWLENRKAFGGRRRHYVAEEVSSGAVVGYGNIEEGPDPGNYRIYVVTEPALLEGEVGTFLFERLVSDLRELEATGAWVREYSRDRATVAFFAERGFEERDRFTLPEHEEMVVLVWREM
ncbi:MAG: hypothetical protein R3272_03915 [Candidatus Promineifilaceae bacterium]|nr:hypothetical protein [Candidatus Promineifilaceae bacterium]